MSSNSDEINHPQILKEISHISFPNLKYLVLIFNKISSIEGICKVYIPSLEQIYLSNRKNT